MLIDRENWDHFFNFQFCLLWETNFMTVKENLSVSLRTVWFMEHATRSHCWTTLKPILAPVLYTICEKCPTIGEIVIEVIKDFADEPISIEFVRFFKIIGSLYSMSDFNHVIGLPVQIIATRMISKIRARNINDIALGLYLCSLLLKSGDFLWFFSSS